MPKVELIYDAECPNVEAAREQLRRAFRVVGQAGVWQEWNRGDCSSPPYARRFGSPTILVNCQDVAGAVPSEGADCCRVYQSERNGLQGVPPVDVITTALRNTALQNGSGRWRSWLIVTSAVGVAMLPKLACPVCWPAYAGLLSSIGLGFLTETTYLLPLTTAFLAVAVGALGFRAQKRRGLGPFVAGLLAAMIVIVGKFEFESDPAMYSGVVLLIGASIWNTWPTRKSVASCPTCAGGEGRGCW